LRVLSPLLKLFHDVQLKSREESKHAAGRRRAGEVVLEPPRHMTPRATEQPVTASVICQVRQPLRLLLVLVGGANGNPSEQFAFEQG
jgi:hypothetical protein